MLLKTNNLAQDDSVSRSPLVTPAQVTHGESWAFFSGNFVVSQFFSRSAPGRFSPHGVL